METRRVVTEDPKQAQWALLSQFIYQPNIVRYQVANGLPEPSLELVNYISGCINQADAYYTSASRAKLDISPLLFYYGTTNLLAGAWALIKGEIPLINDHGMKLQGTENLSEYLRDLSVRPQKSKGGGLSAFCSVFSPNCNMVNGASWTFLEILASIPDVRSDLIVCYDQEKLFVLPVEVVKKLDVFNERALLVDVTKIDNFEEALKHVDGFSANYLKPQQTENHLILHRKLRSKEIGTLSISGQRNLIIPHYKNNQWLAPSQIILFLMGLYVLGSLSRYNPEFWHPFVQKFQTGEKLLVERFLSVSERYIPNLVLDAIHKMHFQFLFNESSATSASTSLTKEDVETIVSGLMQRGKI